MDDSLSNIELIFKEIENNKLKLDIKAINLFDDIYQRYKILGSLDMIDAEDLKQIYMRSMGL